MILKKKNQHDDEIDFIEIILIILNNKFKIFLITFASVIAMFIYQTNQQTLYLATTEIKPISAVDQFEFETYISAFHSDLDKAVSLNQEIIQHSTIKITPLLKDYIKLIGSMDICFLGEGGGMHMAAGLGIPQVVLFGHTSPTTWSPLSAKATIIKDISNVNNIPKKIILLALKNKLIKINSQKNSN